LMEANALNTPRANGSTGTDMGQNDHMTSPRDTALQSRITEQLARLRLRYSQRELAEKLGVSIKTIGRWERHETAIPGYLEPALRDLAPKRPVSSNSTHIDTIDLFAGIGGMRLGFESIGARCVFS